VSVAQAVSFDWVPFAVAVIRKQLNGAAPATEHPLVLVVLSTVIS
jgi:hypothetical protein